jgi:UDP-glucose 4-epimerase
MQPQATVLVTGSSGTIGTALAERLLSEGYDVVGADLVPNRWSTAVDERTVRTDLLDPADLDSLPADVDVVVHLAANARVRALVEQPERARDNFESTFNVLEYVRDNDVSAVVFSSSREVYGNGKETIRGEHGATIEGCESPYAASKMGGEALVESYAECYGIDACVLRFSNVYGRYDASDRVVPQFIARAEQGRALEVYGRNKLLDFTYLDDCVDGILRALKRLEVVAGMTFNIASGEGTSLLALAEAVVDRIGTRSTVRVEDSKAGEVNRFVADVSKASSVLGYEPTRSPLGGLDETIDWYRENGLVDRIAADADAPHRDSVAVDGTPADE